MHPVAISRQGLLLASDLQKLGFDTRSLSRDVTKGTLRRLLRGAYVENAVWSEADARERHILRLRAIDGTRAAQPVFSHASAAALHGLPVLGRWPSMGHVSAERPGRSRNGVAYHQAPVGRIPEHVDGLGCTSLIDTLLDLALSSGFRSATISLDHALHKVALAAGGTNRNLAASPEATRAAAEFTERLLAELRRLGPVRNFRLAEKAISFASHLSDSVGESLSRCGIHLLGEFDGEDKYRNPLHLAGRTPHQALMDEKAREDRIRATDVDVSRWGWKTALELPRLYEQLFAAGLRPSSGH